MNLQLPIHHIGVACKSIEEEMQVFTQLGFKEEANFIDEKQGVRGKFIIPSCMDYPQYRLELLENINEHGVLDSYLKKNNKMYHIAYESKNIQRDLALFPKESLVVVPIIDAVYFAKICFVMMPNRFLIELVELK